MPRIFISYRREDAAGHAGRLYDHLCQYFGAEHVFKDVEAIGPAEDWVTAIQRAIDGSTVMLAVIGRRWLDAEDRDGLRRLMDPHDLVRHEIVSGLAGGLQVVPVLVNGGVSPASQELPEELRPLARLQAVELHDTRWQADVEGLASWLAGGRLRPRPSREGDLTEGSQRRLRLAGVIVASLPLAMGASGYLAEGSFAQLLDIEVVRSPFRTGAQFLLGLLTSLIGIVTAVAVLLLVGTAVATTLRRIRPQWQLATLRRALGRRVGVLLATQILAATVFTVFSLTAFTDILPLAAIPSRSGLQGASLDLIRDGRAPYREAVVMVLALCLSLAGIERWRLRLRRMAAHRSSWGMTLSFLLSTLIYLVGVVEALLLPVGFGLLQLPNSRQYTAAVVVFEDSVVHAELRGGAFLLLPADSGKDSRSFSCLNPPRTWKDIRLDDLESVANHRSGTILELLPEFEGRRGCAAEDLRSSVTARSPGGR